MEINDIAEELSDGAKLGLWALGGIVGGIVAWDYLRSEDTISDSIRSQHDKHPIVGRAVTLSTLGGLAVHLCLDKDTDPIQKAFNKGVDLWTKND